MKTKKTIRLINNERMNRKVISSKGCDTSSTDICVSEDFSNCLIHSFDYCKSKDLAACYHDSDDYCASNGDFHACTYGHNDYL